jgi:hypothetical protein
MTTTSGGIKFELGTNRDIGYEGERNDCTVRALQAVTGVPYRYAHTLLAKKHDRCPGRGIKFESTLRNWAVDKTILFGYRVTLRVAGARETLATTRRHFNTGRYLLIKRGHAFTMIDGVVYDAGVLGARTRVLSVWEFEPSSVVEAREAL